MMICHIHEHFSEKLRWPGSPPPATISERECYRVFRLSASRQRVLKEPPLQTACHLRGRKSESLTFIAHACSLGNSSNFGKIFKKQMDCSLEYRHK